MTLKAKILDYLRTHAEPFTIRMLMEATGGSWNSCRSYVHVLIQDRAIGYAEPKAHDHTKSDAAPFGRWKERKYKKA